MTAVYIPNDSGHDYSDAVRFGELIVLSTGTIDKFSLTEMLRTFDEHLRLSSPDDYIIQAGPSVMLAVACAIFSSRHHRLNLLIWRYEGPGQDHYVHTSLVFKE